MASTAPQTAERMTEAATDFLDALDEGQRALAMLPFDDEAERQTWHYTPIERCGLTLGEMRPQQRRLAMRLMGSGLSMGGFVTASTIIGLEATLEGLDGWPARAYAETRPDVPFRDPGMYYAAVFGEPGGEAPWSWRIGGHHVALQYTIAGGQIVSPTPTFFGAHPAEARQVGTHALRPLAAEEDLARELLHALDEEQRATAVISPAAPTDIVQSNRPRVAEGVINFPLAELMDRTEPARTEAYEREARQRAVLGLTEEMEEVLRYSSTDPRGLVASAMGAPQRELLTALVRQYVDRMPEEIAELEWAKIDGPTFDAIHFAWAGPAEPRQPHYYRLQAPRFLIEFDNVQSDVNHIHSVWRDPEGDFGADILAQHYAHAH